MATPSTATEVEREFVYLASELSDRFPELDLRFNHKSGSRVLRCLLAERPDKILEFRLGTSQTAEILYEAIFSIKELARLFDA